MAPAELPKISVVIPAFNDGARLAACLASVSRQTYPRERVEVIVVDNASTEDLRPVVAACPGARYAHEPVRGPAAARNAGVALATGEVVAFTDADCLPEPDWLERGAARLASEENCGLVGGRVDLAPADPERPTAAELYDRATYLDQKRHVEKSSFAATANLFTRRAVFDAAGGFDARFPDAAGEDFEWGQRVRGKGFRLVYCDEARVVHPAAASVAAVARKARRIRQGMDRLAELRGEAPSGALLFLFRPFFVCARILRGDRLASIRDKAAACLAAFPVHFLSYRSPA